MRKRITSALLASLVLGCAALTPTPKTYGAEETTPTEETLPPLLREMPDILKKQLPAGSSITSWEETWKDYNDDGKFYRELKLETYEGNNERIVDIVQGYQDGKLLPPYQIDIITIERGKEEIVTTVTKSYDYKTEEEGKTEATRDDSRLPHNWNDFEPDGIMDIIKGPDRFVRKFNEYPIPRPPPRKSPNLKQT